MVFGYEYDKSLWLLIAKSEINQKYIAEMINNIPCDKWDDIRLFINDINNGITRNGFQFVLNNFKYILNVIDGELLVKVIEKDADFKDLIEWSFVPIDIEQIQTLKYFKPVYLGSCFESVSFGEHGDGTYLEEYEFVKTPIGNYVRTYCNYDKKSVSRKMVDIKAIPSEIYVHQFANEKRINRLVRRKKRKI